MGALNILTDILMIALPFWMLRSIRMSVQKKAIVLSCFSLRVL